jgi:hypothetical protein
MSPIPSEHDHGLHDAPDLDADVDAVQMTQPMPPADDALALVEELRARGNTRAGGAWAEEDGTRCARLTAAIHREREDLDSRCCYDDRDDCPHHRLLTREEARSGDGTIP